MADTIKIRAARYARYAHRYGASMAPIRARYEHDTRYKSDTRTIQHDTARYTYTHQRRAFLAVSANALDGKPTKIEARVYLV